MSQYNARHHAKRCRPYQLFPRWSVWGGEHVRIEIGLGKSWIAVETHKELKEIGDVGG